MTTSLSDAPSEGYEAHEAGLTFPHTFQTQDQVRGCTELPNFWPESHRLTWFEGQRGRAGREARSNARGHDEKQ